jgi:glutamate-1-semialdehyde 2,1-aminomutase
MTAGISTLKKLEVPGVWEKLETAVDSLTNGIGEIMKSKNIPVTQTRVGTMFSTFFIDTPVKGWDSVKECDTEKFSQYFSNLLENGVYIAPSQFEAGFISVVHTDEIIQNTLMAVEKSI